MHGSLFRTHCLNRKCRQTKPNFDSPICKGLEGTENDFEDRIREIPEQDLPHCTKCKTGLLRPGVVWFGESIPLLGKIDPILDGAALIIVVGTSSLVQPAANFAATVQRNGGQVAVFNLPDQGERDADWIFEGSCEVTLPEVLGTY